MSLQPFPFYHNNWWRPFHTDMRLMRNLMDMDSPSHSPTVEPSYSYEADQEKAHFEIELPGVAKEDIQVDVDEHKLIVKAKRFKKRFQQSDGEERKPHLTYLLEARLGHGADLENIKADSVGDGILIIDVPIKVERGTRRIEVGM